MRINVTGRPPLGVTPKDVVMEIIRRIGADGATGYAVEFALKACIAKTINQHDFPDKELAMNSYIHEIGKRLE